MESCIRQLLRFADLREYEQINKAYQEGVCVCNCLALEAQRQHNTRGSTGGIDVWFVWYFIVFIGFSSYLIASVALSKDYE